MKKKFLNLFIFLIFTVPSFGQSLKKEACFLFIGGEIENKKGVIDQLVRPLLSSFVSPIKNLPPSGLTNSQQNSSCFYDVSISMTGDKMNLSITGQRTPVDLSGLAKSNLLFPDNVLHSTLRILHNNLSNLKKEEICQKYSYLLIEECPQKIKLLIVFRKDADSNKESLNQEPRTNIVSGIESIVNSMEGVDLVGISELGSNEEIDESQKTKMNDIGANSLMMVSIEWAFEKQETSMWKGIVSMNINMESYKLQNGGLVNLGGVTVDPQRIPIRKWGKTKSFKKKNLQRISKKVISKWSEDELINLIRSI